jgi:hypothetical protein
VYRSVPRGTYFYMIRVFTTILFVLTILCNGCKSRDPNPELKDLVYQDLMREAASAASLAETSQKKIETIHKDLLKVAPRSLELKNLHADLRKQQDLVKKFTELSEYYTIRAKIRLIEGKKRYNRRFKEELPWPDEKEYSYYKLNKDLNRASRNWNDRVPKPSSVINYQGASTEIKAEATGAEGEAPKNEN